MGEGKRIKTEMGVEGVLVIVVLARLFVMLGGVKVVMQADMMMAVILAVCDGVGGGRYGEYGVERDREMAVVMMDVMIVLEVELLMTV